MIWTIIALVLLATGVGLIVAGIVSDRKDQP